MTALSELRAPAEAGRYWRVAPEQVFIRRVKRDTGLWVYGARGKMRHDLHEGGDARTRGRSYDVYAYHAARYRNGVDST